MKNYNDIVEKKGKKLSYIKKRKAVRLWGCKAVKIKKRGYKKEGCKDEKKGLWRKGRLVKKK